MRFWLVTTDTAWQVPPWLEMTPPRMVECILCTPCTKPRWFDVILVGGMQASISLTQPAFHGTAMRFEPEGIPTGVHVCWL